MQLIDKFTFTPNENIRFARSSLAKLVHQTSRLLNVSSTYPQTQTIIDGVSVSGITITELLIIVHLKKAFYYTINLDQPINFDTEIKINQLVNIDDVLTSTKFKPNIEIENQYLTKILEDTYTSTTDKALTLMYHTINENIFPSYNLPTAIIMANKIMIQGGAGLISIPSNKLYEWKKLLTKYSITNDMTELKLWTYQNAIFGISVRKNNK